MLSGGSTLFDGFSNRLQKNIQNRVDARIEGYMKKSGAQIQGIEVGVHQNMVQRFAVWFGGSVLGANPNFPRLCKSKQ